MSRTIDLDDLVRFAHILQHTFEKGRLVQDKSITDWKALKEAIPDFKSLPLVDQAAWMMTAKTVIEEFIPI